MITKTVLESYKQYGRVLCVSNEIAEAYVTLDVGPRIIRFGFVGGQNILRDDRDNHTDRTDQKKCQKAAQHTFAASRFLAIMFVHIRSSCTSF